MSTSSPAIGTLRERVQLLTKTSVDDGAGGHELVFVPLATVWARVYERSASRSEVADARTAQDSHTITLRFRTDISAGDRMTWRGRSFEVLSAEDLNGRRAWLVCVCTEAKVSG